MVRGGRKEVFFIKQKTAYEIRLSLVGSEMSTYEMLRGLVSSVMCIRDRSVRPDSPTPANLPGSSWFVQVRGLER